jgi:hypothetical protein
MAQETAPLLPEELLELRQRCAKLPPHDPLVRLLATLDREKMESDVLRRLLRDERRESDRLVAAIDRGG